jgi:hypothetical protein
MWARAYSQFIAKAGNDAAMQAEIAARRDGTHGHEKASQWHDGDFKGVFAAIRALFTHLDWMP